MADTVKLEGDSPQRVALDLMKVHISTLDNGAPTDPKELIKLYRKFYAATYYNPNKAEAEALFK